MKPSGAPGPLTIIPVALSGEVKKGAKLGDVILAALAEAGCSAEDGDVLVVTHKIVSKAEGRVVEIDGNEAKAAVVEGEAAKILRRRNGLIIAETRHGLVCANAGVDSSNVAPGHLVLLPADPDASARRIRQRIKAKTGQSLGVVISDTFGRPWRVGQTNIAIGVAGFLPLTSYIGTEDTFGNRLKATSIAIADELAAAAEIVMGKSEGIPLALIRGAPIREGRGSAAQLIRRPAEDLFR